MLLEAAVLFHFTVAETFFVDRNQLLGFLIKVLVESVPDSEGRLVFIDPEAYWVYGLGDDDNGNIPVSRVPLFNGSSRIKVLRR